MDEDLNRWFEPGELCILIGLLKDHRERRLGAWIEENKDNIKISRPTDTARFIEDVRRMWVDSKHGQLYKKLKALLHIGEV